MLQGRIVKGISGFYYVHAEDGGIYACKARGIFRKDGIKPLAGDVVDMEVTHEDDMEGNVITIHPRRNALIRPPVANVDAALAVVALKEPVPDLHMLDVFLAYMNREGIDCSICINKADLGDEEIRSRFRDYYSGGYPVIFTSTLTGEGIEELSELLEGKVTTVAGTSGVGKSSLINRLSPGAELVTGEVSRKIGRGRQTTRHTELLCLREGTYIFDTPGFSSLELQLEEAITLRDLYPEFVKYNDKCYYNTCSHIHEPDCAVKQALEEGMVNRDRYRGYTELFREISDMNARRPRRKNESGI